MTDSQVTPVPASISAVSQLVALGFSGPCADGHEVDAASDQRSCYLPQPLGVFCHRQSSTNAPAKSSSPRIRCS